MWMFLFFFLFQTGPSPCKELPAQTPSPALMVQVVDPSWLPISGADVTLKSLDGDARTATGREKTGNDGYAKFSIPADDDYDIEVESAGFKHRRLKHVRLFRWSGSSPTAYVQMKMTLSGPGIKID